MGGNAGARAARVLRPLQRARSHAAQRSDAHRLPKHLGTRATTMLRSCSSGSSQSGSSMAALRGSCGGAGRVSRGARAGGALPPFENGTHVCLVARLVKLAPEARAARREEDGHALRRAARRERAGGGLPDFSLRTSSSARMASTL